MKCEYSLYSIVSSGDYDDDDDDNNKSDGNNYLVRF